METEELKTHFAGYVLAEIVNKACFSSKSQEGFLYGDCNLESVPTISDMRHDGLRETAVITIKDCCSCEDTFSFYNQIGSIYDEKLKMIHDGRDYHCIGFYSIRRNSKLTISLREKTIIQNLLRSHAFQHKKLIFLLVIPSEEENKATLNVNYKSFICDLNATPIAVKTEVIDLGDNGGRSYNHKSLLVNKKTDSYTNSMQLLQEYTSDKFLSETGSVALADTAYSMLYKTSVLVKNLKDQLSGYNLSIEQYTHQIEDIENQSKEMNEK